MAGLDRKYVKDKKIADEIKAKEGREIEPELKVAKSYNVDPKAIKIIPGFNVRTVDPVHVDNLAAAYTAGRAVPPVLVAIGEDGSLELVDGEHRVRGAIQANMRRIQIFEFEGTQEERIAMAISSSQGRNLSPVERAVGYKRLRNAGWTDAEIAESVGRSEGDVANHILLAECGKEVMDMVTAGTIKATPTINLARAIGPEKVLTKLNDTLSQKAQDMADVETTSNLAQEAADEAQAAKGTKTTPATKKPASKKKAAKKPIKLKASDLQPFGKKEALAVTELTVQIELLALPDGKKLEDVADDAPVQLQMPAKYYRELAGYISKYLNEK